MKRILTLAIAFTLFTVAASAQQRDGKVRKQEIDRRFDNGQLTRGEKYKLHKNDVRYKRSEHRFKKDGKFTRAEKRKLHKMKRHDHKQSFRFKHNDRKRVR